MRKKFRFLTVLAVCVMVLSCFSLTAFAYADDTEQNLPVTEATQPEQQPETTTTPEKPKGEPIDDEGNAYTRDLLYDKATNKQFITIRRRTATPSISSLTTMHPSMRTRNSIRHTSSTWSMRATYLHCWMKTLRLLWPPVTARKNALPVRSTPTARSARPT